MLSKIRIILRNLTGFTLLELLVVMTIIVILAGMMLPALQQARKKAHHIRWLGIKKSTKIDPHCLLYLTFEEMEGNPKNLAMYNPGEKYYDPKAYNIWTNGDVSWEEGRFPGKGALLFNGGGGANYLRIDRTKNNRPYYGSFCYEDFTIEVWLHFAPSESDYINNGFGTIATDYSGYPGWLFDLTNYGGTPGRPYIRMKTTCTEGGGAIPAPVSESSEARTYWDQYSIPYDDKWHHIVASMKRSPTSGMVGFEYESFGGAIYFDGERANKGGSGALVLDYTICLRRKDLQRMLVGQDSYGLIDEFTIFDYALSADEVRQRYKMGKP